MLLFGTNHDKPCDQSCISDVPEVVVVDVRLHLQVEEEALVDDVGNPAKTSGQKKYKFNSRNFKCDLNLNLTPNDNVTMTMQRTTRL